MTTSAEADNTTPSAVSVVIVSWCRPDYVRSCLQHLAYLEGSPDEVIVVDASPDELTAAVVREFPGVRRVAFPGGAGHMTTSRNVGLTHVTGEIVAFIDDDANVRPGWLRGLLNTFADPSVDAVAGRTCNGLEGEENQGVGSIGRVLPDGELAGNFAADPGEVTDVDHGIGANMSFRREALARLGGFRDDFIGVGGVREDTDIFLRLRALGLRAVFAPDAVVDHVGAPHVEGRRFDYRYVFSARRNHALLLARNYGMGSSQFRIWIAREIGRVVSTSHPNFLRRAVRVAFGLAAVLAGIGTSIRKARWGASDPIRRDQTGEHLRGRLTNTSTIG
jgi:GT2 family glycosyltransferase